MKKNLFKKACLTASAIAFSLSAHSGGGGSDGGGSDGLPLPDTCTSNCGYEVGPNPTLSALQASQGPLSVSSTIVPSSVSGFGGGTIYFPSNAQQELAAIAVAPGFTNYQSAIQWWGPLLASHGYVVITIDTNGRFDNPNSRSLQLDAALSHLIDEGNRASSPISGIVDENRLATMGFSMGGGGSLISASRNRLSAAVPLAPWNSGGNDFDQIGVPTMIMACENDSTASVNSHASPFYNTIPNSTDKAYMEITNGPHNCANGDNGNGNDALLSTYGVSWMKRFLDKDQRYAQFLCGPNHIANPSINEYRDNCNY